jgi:hypothetical protein
MKTNFYTVKIKVEILDKKLSFKIYNIEAENEIVAKSKAWLIAQQSATYKMEVTGVIIKGEKCKTI